MSYIVYARKWRPQSFDQIVGQEHITTTLKNAIKQDRVAHAYLFCGPRGIGKTTTARILAKALNCAKGPTPSPCNKCVSCIEITESKSMDIIEIDGASNRGIDKIRNLKENIKFSPQHGQFKVYIIDEVHMLTTEAFNALLKTLEEPPAHVKFIFATTAAYKVIPTILSRCQRFNFRRLSSHDIARKLKEIAKKEGVSIEEAALFNIVRQSAGSMRDAESLMDQLATYCKNKITAEDTSNILGLVEQDRLYQFAQHIIDKDTPSAIKFISKIMDEGTDPNQFLLSLVEYFRNAMLIREGKSLTPLLELTKDEVERISTQIKPLSREDILYILYSMMNVSNNMRWSSMPKVSLELLAVKLSSKESIVSLGEIMNRLNSLEKARTGVTEAGAAEVKANSADSNIASAVFQEIKPIPLDESKPELYRVREALQLVIKKIRQEKIYVASCLEEGRLIDFKDSVITLGFYKKNIFHKESLEKPQNRDLIENNFNKALGSQVRVEFVITEDSKQLSDTAKAEKPGQARQSSLKRVLSDPIIKSALDIFDGNIMKFM